MDGAIKFKCSDFGDAIVNAAPEKKPAMAMA